MCGVRYCKVVIFPLDSSVNVVTRLWAGYWRFHLSVPGRTRGFGSSPPVQISSGPQSSHWVSRALFLGGVEWPGHVLDHSFPFSAEFKNEWNYISTPTNAFMTCTGTNFPLCTWTLCHSAMGYKVPTDSAPWFRTDRSAVGYRVPTDSASWFRMQFRFSVELFHLWINKIQQMHLICLLCYKILPTRFRRLRPSQGGLL
jgi:hypothetical protein